MLCSWLGVNEVAGIMFMWPWFVSMVSELVFVLRLSTFTLLSATTGNSSANIFAKPPILSINCCLSWKLSISACGDDIKRKSSNKFRLCNRDCSPFVLLRWFRESLTVVRRCGRRSTPEKSVIKYAKLNWLWSHLVDAPVSRNYFASFEYFFWIVSTDSVVQSCGWKRKIENQFVRSTFCSEFVRGKFEGANVNKLLQICTNSDFMWT